MARPYKPSPLFAAREQTRRIEEASNAKLSNQTTDNEITELDIERALGTVARVIELYGDAYFPILRRLESEPEERRTRRATLERHLATYWESRTQPRN